MREEQSKAQLYQESTKKDIQQSEYYHQGSQALKGKQKGGGIRIRRKIKSEQELENLANEYIEQDDAQTKEFMAQRQQPGVKNPFAGMSYKEKLILSAV